MSMSVLIFLALFIYGMAGVYLFGEQMPEQWGDITAALTSLFILLTLEEFATYLVDGLAVSPWALPFYISYVFVIVFTILNVLIGVVLNAMDEAREENKERKRKMIELDTIVHEVDDITADGKVTEDEIGRLREQLKIMETILHDGQKRKKP